ncbi:MAG: efflux RND transporter permease subunit [Microcystaceae cyanobacterium]
MTSNWRERLNISRFAIKYARLTICFWIGVVVAGIFAFSSLQYALFPDVTFPVVVVNTPETNLSLLETEKQITQPLENALMVLDDTADLYSSTYQGQSVINITFIGGINLSDATEAVQNIVNEVKLPNNLTPKVIPFNISESPAVSYALTSEEKSLGELAILAQNNILPQIEKVSGVLRVDLLGDATYRDYDTQTPNQNPPTLVRFNGEDVIAFQVIKQANANTLEIVRKVEQISQDLQVQFPEINFTLAESQADYIRQATRSTIDALIGAIILAILVIYPFLRNFAATVITALAIPISLLGTVIVMAWSGFNLETLTLLALALVIGIIVDDAIVDVENIARHLDKGENPRQAAIKGTDEIGLTVAASTLTIVAVFLPIALMGSTLGQFFKPFALTISAAVITSLLVARTLSPVLAVYWLKPRKTTTSVPRSSSFSLPFTHTYRNLLNWSLDHRGIIILIAIGSFILGIALIPFIPQGFVPKLDRGEFNIIYKIPTPKLNKKLKNADLSNLSQGEQNTGGAFNWVGSLGQSPERIILRKTRRTGKKLEEVILQQPDVKSVYLVSGLRGDPTRGKLYVKLKSDRSLTTSQVQSEIRNTLPQLDGVSVSVEDIVFVQTANDAPVKIALLGDNLDSLNQLGKTFKKEVSQLSGIEDIDITQNDPEQEVQHYNQKRAVFLRANLDENTALGEATQKIVNLAPSILPNNINLKVLGDSNRSQLILKEFGVTLTLSIICMLVVLYIPFKRFLEPMVVGLSLPLSLIGAMLALLLTQSEFGMISLIGLIFLLGLLDKNAILLMDYINQLRQQGMSRREAILETGTVRLRPILMTTFSTILGMMPIALGLGAGAELRQPMAVAIIGGLIASSLLSLIVVPVLYTLLEDSYKKWF